MNLYRGCCHGCIYCDSRSECYHVEDFDTVHAKENALEILRDELRRKVRSGIIGTGAMSDPYNPFEKTELLTRHALELISAYGFGITVITKSDLITRDFPVYVNITCYEVAFGITVITKSDLITRDIDVYREITENSPALCKMTITTADDDLCRIIEPNVSVASERFEALAKMADSGLFTGITLMPVLPFIEDSIENIRNIVRTAHQCGVRCIYPFFGVTLRTNQRENFLSELDKRFPDSNLRQKYVNHYGDRYECVSPNGKKLWKVFTEDCDRYGILYNMKSIISAYKMGYGDMQLSFF